MTDLPGTLVAQLDRATERLFATVRALDGSSVDAPSRCAGWTRGHVLTHLARNADGTVNLLNWARTGVPTPKYASEQQRDADIEAGAGRPMPDQLADLSAAVDRLNATISLMSPVDWAAKVGESGHPAVHTLWTRLREVEVHHVDLAAGYTPGDWPDDVLPRLFAEALDDRADIPARLVDAGTGAVLAERPGPTVTGSKAALTAWLMGRSDGSDLKVEGGDLPTLADWR
jgi:maleylpyruvate isomerase